MIKAGNGNGLKNEGKGRSQFVGRFTAPMINLIIGMMFWLDLGWRKLKQSWTSVSLFVSRYAELIVIGLIMGLMALMDYRVLGSYAFLEFFWDLTAIMAVLYFTGATSLISYVRQNGWKFREALQNVSPNKTTAWKWFVANRAIAFVQPAFGLYLSILVFRISFWGWGALGYVYMVVDILTTVWSYYAIKRKFFPKLQVREGTAQDLTRLDEIDKIAFPLPEQQESIEVFGRRMETGGICLVLEHPKVGVVGSMWCRLLVAKDVIEDEEGLTWKKLARNGDFTPEEGADTLYVVGIAGLPGYDASKFLEPAGMRWVVKLGLKGAMGGLRIPGFGRSDLDLETYVHAKRSDGTAKDAYIRTFMKNAYLPGVGSLAKPVRGIENYFYDPASRHCAALMLFTEPLRQTRFGEWVLDRSRFVRELWGWVLEQLILHL